VWQGELEEANFGGRFPLGGRRLVRDRFQIGQEKESRGRGQFWLFIRIQLQHDFCKLNSKLSAGLIHLLSINNGKNLCAANIVAL
jgi:hypothetical protein